MVLVVEGKSDCSPAMKDSAKRYDIITNTARDADKPASRLAVRRGGRLPVDIGGLIQFQSV